MKLLDMIPVELLTPNIVRSLLSQFGVNSLNDELISLFLAAIKDKGYKTLNDVASDKELIEDLVSLASSSFSKSLDKETEKMKSNSDNDSVNSESVAIHLDTPFCCPKCGEITTLRGYQKRFKERLEEK